MGSEVPILVADAMILMLLGTPQSQKAFQKATSAIE